MVSFGHSAVGTLVGLAAYQMAPQDNPASLYLYSFGLGVLSHYICDFIPHGHFIPQKNFKKKIIWVIIFDLGLSILIFSALAFLNFGFSTKFLTVLFGIAGAQIPDVFDGLMHIGFLQKKGLLGFENRFHNDVIHWHGALENALKFGKRDIWQVAVAILTIMVLLKV